MTDSQQPMNPTGVSAVPPLIQSAPPLAMAADPSGDIVATETRQLDSFHNEFAVLQEGYTSNYIQLADTKAAWTFAVSSGILTYIFNNDSLHAILNTPECSVIFFLLGASVLLFACSAIFSFLVIAPRLKTSGEGIIFFGAVASRASADIYVQDISAKSKSDLAELRIRHCYDLARICHSKYQWLKTSLCLGVPALVAFLVLLLLH